MPAQFSKWASVMDTHATPGASKVKGRATREEGLMSSLSRAKDFTSSGMR
jgi:hypothetical protein